MVAVWCLDGAAPSRAGLLAAGARRALFLLDYPLAERLAEAAWLEEPGFEQHVLVAETLGILGHPDAETHMVELLAEAATGDELEIGRAHV